MPYQSSVSYDSIVLIESLDEQHATGTALFHATIKPQCLREGVYAELYHVRSKSELIGALRAAGNLARDGRSPIIHLEAHGNQQGLALLDGDEVPWRELAPALGEVNELTRLNLLVIAAACHGWYLSEILRPTDRAPFWGIIGPPEVATGGEIRQAMENFYNTLLALVDLGAAMRAMNAGAEPANWAYRLQTADLLYCDVFRHYMTVMREEETQAERVNRLVAEVARVRGLDVSQTMVVRREITEEIENDEFWYDMYKTRFLMLDKYPENEKRFALRFSDCARKAV